MYAVKLLLFVLSFVAMKQRSCTACLYKALDFTPTNYCPDFQLLPQN